MMIHKISTFRLLLPFSIWQSHKKAKIKICKPLELGSLRLMLLTQVLKKIIRQEVRLIKQVVLGKFWKNKSFIFNKRINFMNIKKLKMKTLIVKIINTTIWKIKFKLYIKNWMILTTKTIITRCRTQINFQAQFTAQNMEYLIIIQKNWLNQRAENSLLITICFFLIQIHSS